MAQKRKEINPRRGEVWLVNFDPSIGAEIRKTRPALILQNDIANRHSPVTIVAALTSQFEEPLYPTEAFIEKQEGGLTVRSVVLLNQVRTIDKRRLVRRLGGLAPQTMERVNQVLEISLGIIEI